MADCDPEVWLFYPKGSGHYVRDAVRSKCRDRDWSCVDRTTSKMRIPQGRPIQRANTEDATSLYRSIHARRIGVWQVGEANVPVIPRPKKSPNHYVTLRQFVKYKAFHCRIDPNKLDESLEESAIRFKSWIDTTRCDGEGDPRCLPFHVFEADLGIHDLDTPDGRRGFARRHGQQGSRIDDNGIRWERPVARQMHGQPILQVAGRALIQGFHWDVTSSRRKSRSWTLTTTSEEWEIKRNGHVNVYPNSQIRGSKASRRVYSTRKQKPA